MKIPKISKSDISRPVLALIAVGAICKGVISSSSLYIQHSRYYRVNGEVPSSCSVISLIGNIGATAVVLLGTCQPGMVICRLAS